MRCLGLSLAVAGAHAQDLKSFEQRTTVKVLPNGLTLIICERHEAPVFSYTTFIDAGDVNDPSGESGLAHMFEHLAFKGTTQIGTKDYPAEKVALEKVEAANDAYEAEYLKPIGRSDGKARRRCTRPFSPRRPRPRNTSSPTSSLRLPSRTARTI